MIFRNRKRTGRDRKQESQQRETRRRKIANLMTSRTPTVELLEDRRLLASFANSGVITINDDTTATPYPSSINVSGLTGNVVDVNVNIIDLNHGFADDVGLLLVGPGGQSSLLMGDSGGSNSLTNVDLTFDDLATSGLPDSAPIVSGTYLASLGTAGSPEGLALPTSFPGPAPAGPYSTDLTSFAGAAANGQWNLYVLDDTSSDTGSINSGWSIDIITTDPVFSGTSSDNAFEMRINVNDPTLLDVVVDGDTRSFAIGAINSITINGGDGDDSLLIDYTNGNPVPGGGLSFNGQGQGAGDGDVLAITNPAAFTDQVLTYTTTTADGNDGTIQIDGGATITYTGLEPIVAGNSANTILNLPAGFANDATLQDNTATGFIEIIDNGATFEDTVIPNPTNSLTVNLGNVGDLLQVNALDSNYAASLIINGGTGIDDVNLDHVDLINTPGRGLLVTGTEGLGITDGTISGNTAVIGGGILIENSSTIATIDGTTISGNTASGAAVSDGGGGIFNNGAALTISGGASITGNVANGTLGNGGGIFNNGGFLDVVNSSITGNLASRAGGGIENNLGTVALSGVDLDNNNAGINGGGLHISGAGIATITNGSASDNTAGQEGGGLWNSSSGTLTIDGTLIDGNTANAGNNGGNDQGGGGVFNDGGTLDIDNATITGNLAPINAGNGGGVMTVGGTATIGNTTISGNMVARAGGGIENNAGMVTLNDVTADGNNAGVNGGGLHVSGAGTTNVNGGLFQNNVAAQEGGGLWNGSGVMTISGTTITSNTASGAGSDQGGGGVFNAGGTINISNALITNNVADGTSGSGGGILNDAAGTVTVNTSTIAGNTATRAGGGIETTAGTSNTITDSTISGNNAGSSPGNGGGVHITSTGTVNIEGSTIEGNTANEGGGIWNSGVGTFALTNTTISGNTATGSDGGGIFNTDGGSITTDSVTITLNDASTGVGSGVAGGTGGVTLENTIVAQNPGGGTEENLSGSINSDDFNLIGDADNGTLTGMTVNTIFAADALLLPLTNNGGPTETHLPGSGSPAIGFGLTTLPVDQRDVLRPQGGQDDIGAVEVDLNGYIITADSFVAGNVGDGNPDEFKIINDAGGITGNVQVYVNSQLCARRPQSDDRFDLDSRFGRRRYVDR